MIKQACDKNISALEFANMILANAKPGTIKDGIIIPDIPLNADCQACEWCNQEDRCCLNPYGCCIT